MTNRCLASRYVGKARHGMVLIAVMVFLLIAVMMVLAWLRVAALERRTFRALVQRSQAEWLAESAIDRAVIQLKIDPEYKGETWNLSAEELQGKDAATVVIEVAPVEEQSKSRKITVQADYPIEPERRNRRTKTIQISLGQGESR